MNWDLPLPEAHCLSRDVITPRSAGRTGSGKPCPPVRSQTTRWEQDWAITSPSTYKASTASHEQSLCPGDVWCHKDDVLIWEVERTRRPIRPPSPPAGPRLTSGLQILTEPLPHQRPFRALQTLLQKGAIPLPGSRCPALPRLHLWDLTSIGHSVARAHHLHFTMTPSANCSPPPCPAPGSLKHTFESSYMCDLWGENTGFHNLFSIL